MTELTDPKIDADMRREAVNAIAGAYMRIRLVGQPHEIAQLWCFILVAAERLAPMVGVRRVVEALRSVADRIEAEA